MKIRRAAADRRQPQVPPSDLTVVQRAGRVAAMQASSALAAVLLVVGAVVFTVDVRVQNHQISAQLEAVAATADDVNDPPPGMELVLRDHNGRVSASDGGQPGVELLSRPAGFVDVHEGHNEFRALVMDRPEGRVVAMLDLAPYHDGRNRLLLSLGFAELAGILASIAVVVLFTRRSVRPLAQALALQRRFVADRCSSRSSSRTSSGAGWICTAQQTHRRYVPRDRTLLVSQIAAVVDAEAEICASAADPECGFIC